MVWSRFKILFALSLVIILIASLEGCNTKAKYIEDNYVYVTPSQANELILSLNANLVIVDIRTPDEYNSGHLATASNLDFSASDFLVKVRQLSPSKNYLIYCRSGARTEKAKKLLENYEVPQVYILDGGIAAWQRDSLPIVKLNSNSNVK